MVRNSIAMDDELKKESHCGGMPERRPASLRSRNNGVFFQKVMDTFGTKSMRGSKLIG